ncbi:MAG: lytic transglycosylase domain-containing protein [Rhodocyclaceae bacterium]|nr:lytic transglycosylase domain-containing protein [Rhodocyclaceae bacterium]
MQQQEQRYRLPRGILLAVAQVESNLNPAAIQRNPNGTYDIGLMQINSSHLPWLRRHGITEAMLLDGCTNVAVGAWLLAEKFGRYGLNWHAVAAYNTGNPYRKPTAARHYVQKVYAYYAANSGVVR